MRLLNVSTLRIHTFVSDVPPYATLSHLWGKAELSFEEMENLDSRPGVRTSEGFNKIKNLCREVRSRSLSWVWTDTCCLDRRNPSELSEAVNSWYRWFQQAVICLVHLPDVEPGLGHVTHFASSSWFTRGWTLQELLAPKALIFFDAK